MDNGTEIIRLKRTKVRFVAKRESCAARIRALYWLARQVKSNPEVAPKLSVAESKLDAHWNSFRVWRTTLFWWCCVASVHYGLLYGCAITCRRGVIKV